MHHLTTRALLLLLLVTPLLAAASLVPPLLWIAGATLLLILGALVVDRRLAADPRDLEVERRHDEKLSLGAANPIFLHIHSRARAPVGLRLRDEPPDDFDTSTLLLDGVAQPRETLVLRYTVTPHRRGDYRMGDATLRWAGPLGLVVRQHTYPLAAPVRVYPNLLQVRRYELLARSGRLEEMGLRRARRFGRGTDFDRLREYTTDDEYRQISWKATARRGRPIAVEYQVERAQILMTLLDAGRLMRAPIGRLSKLDYAINTTLLLGYIAGLRGDLVGNLTFADDVLGYLAPRPGKGQFHRLLERLYNIQSQPTAPDYRRAINTLKLKRPRRSLVVLFTDLTTGSNLDELVEALASLRPRHLPMVVTMADPGVLALAEQPLESVEALYEQVVAQRLLAERRLVLDRLEARGVLTLDAPASRLTPAVINRYLEIKARGML